MISETRAGWVQLEGGITRCVERCLLMTLLFRMLKELIAFKLAYFVEYVFLQLCQTILFTRFFWVLQLSLEVSLCDKPFHLYAVLTDPAINRVGAKIIDVCWGK